MDIDFAAPAPLLSAGLLLAKNHIYTMAWLDDDLIVTARFGELAPGLEVGESLSTCLPVLADYEEEIRSLPHDQQSSFELPGIMLVTPGRQDAPRIDIMVFRHGDPIAANADAHAGPTPNDAGPRNPQSTNCFLVLVTRAGTQTMDLAMARMQRERQMLLEDIAQKKLELDRVNAELELSNRDLEDFATIISHDLKAPMRALRYLADDIETSLGTNDRQAARDACTDLKVQSRRMSTMLSQLLDYASVGRQKNSSEVCDTRLLIDEVATSLPRPSGMRLHVQGDWPVVATYIAPLDLVLRNLIDNAIKHHDKPQDGEIRIVAERSGDTLEILISDDGPGIPLSRQEAVFYPFRSFSGDAAGGSAADSGQASSEGMGLAFVKRTIETVGGSLTLTSDPTQGRGSSFLVAWPLSRQGTPAG